LEAVVSLVKPLLRALAFFLIVGAVAGAARAQAARAPASTQLPTAQSSAVLFLPGYRAEISGATMAYHSPHPDAQASLLARAMREVQAVSWETDPVPAAGLPDTLAFVWIMGLSGSKGVQRFDLSVAGARRFTFTTAADSTSTGFSVPGPNGSSFAFRVTMVDRYGDLFGFATLRVPRGDVVPGRPLVLEVRGEDAASRAWYMTFQHRFSTHPRITQNPVLLRRPGGGEAELHVLIDDLEGGGAASVELPGRPPVQVPLVFGGNVVTLPTGPVDAPRDQRVVVRVRGAVALDTTLRLAPVAQRDLYVLPYSHNDIGYSDLQVNVERLQWRNLETALDLLERTRDYPDDARYRWNVEILWPVESWLAQATPAQRARFLAAVRAGAIGLNAFLGGVQSGLATAPEMTHYFDVARRLRDQDSVPVETAVISDIPGQSWGIVTALRQSGVRWLAIAPNNGDRIGYTIETWGDRPFWWTSPSRSDSVLTWVAGASYSLFHDAAMRQGGEPKLYALMRRLEEARSPYRQVQLPYTINGDNGPNDPMLSDFVRDWNARYVSPRLIVSTHARMFRDLETQEGRGLPVASGDFTTYWDDGVASTAAEVTLARRASDRLVQAEAVWAMRDPSSFPADAFTAAWREVVLWDEHTWGAAASVETPDAPDVRAQWAYKRAFALRADTLSRRLLVRALEVPAGSRSGPPPRAALSPALPHAFDVVNTSSWVRTDLVVVPAGLSRTGGRVRDAAGRVVPSQRLTTGELAVLVRDVPPLSARRYTVAAGRWVAPGAVAWSRAQPPGRSVPPMPLGTPYVLPGWPTVESDRLRLTVDTATGAIASLVWRLRGAEVVDRRARHGLGEYLYVLGKDSSAARSVSGVRFGGTLAPPPLVAWQTSRADAPGARSFTQEIRVVAGLDRVDIVLRFDKLPVREKEAVHVAFPFLVLGGQVRFDVASGIVRPDSEQLRGSLRNFVTVQSWADVSNDSVGVTWATPDAPLVEVGGIFAELPWMRAIPRTQTLLSYAMNNYWHTNFKAEQGGPVEFRFALRPHGPYRPDEAVRFGMEQRAPLLVVPASRTSAPAPPLLTVSPAGVVVTSIRPTSDGLGWLVQLQNPTDESQQVRLTWRRGTASALRLSDSAERSGAVVSGALSVPARATVLVRAERARTLQ
jgi:hypothetical protein